MATSREVSLDGGAPWGFRITGGQDNNQVLCISRVNPGSKASLKGVREGDLITSINGRPTKEITNSEAHTLLKSAGDRLILGLNEDCQNSPKRRPYKTILHHHHQEIVQETSKTSTLTSHTTLITSENQRKSNCEGSKESSNSTSSSEPTKVIKRSTNGIEVQKPLVINNENVTAATVSASNDILNDKNPFRQSNQSNDRDLQEEEQQEIDETPTVTPIATPSTLTPTSSHYSSDTRGVGVSLDVHIEHREHTDLEDFEDLSEDNGEMPQNKRHKKRKHKHKGDSTKKSIISSKDALIEENSVPLELPPITKEKLLLNQIESNWKPIEILENNYRVESPVCMNPKDVTAMPVALSKSKSLDSFDQDMSLKITELKSSDELSDDEVVVKACNEAVISEADSDVDWEITDELDLNESLIEDKNCSNLSSQEEAQLRYFIDKLNLPGATGVRVEEGNCSKEKEDKSSNAIRLKRNERRQLMQYFAPMHNNSRFLEAITEEGNDQNYTGNVKIYTEDTLKEEEDPTKECNIEEDIVNIVSFMEVGQQGKAEVVILESESSSASDEHEEQFDDTQKTPPPSPEKNVEDFNEDHRSDERSKDCETEDNNYSYGNNLTESEKDKVGDNIEYLIQKDITIKEEIEETTRNVQKFEILVKKTFTSEESNKTLQSPQCSKNYSTEKDLVNLSKDDSLNLKDPKNLSFSEDIDEEIAVVEQKILQTELNIAHDQELIDQLQNSLEQDQKEIQEAHDEIQHLKSFEKEFKEVLTENNKIAKAKERSTSRSSDSSNSSKSSKCTTVVLNASVKDMASITAEADEAESKRNQRQHEPLTLKEYCLKCLLELPFGPAALEELALVSDNLEDIVHRIVALKETKSSISKDHVNETNKQIVEEQEVQQNADGFTIVTKTIEEVKKSVTEEVETIKEENQVENIIHISSRKKLLDIIIKEKEIQPDDNVQSLEELQQLSKAKDKSLLVLPKRQPTPERPPRRRRSLPPELHMKQMQYLIEKEKQIQSQLEQLEVAKRRLVQQMLAKSEGPPRPKSLPPHEEIRQRMYDEYQKQLAEREERRTQKVIKISLNDSEEMKTTPITREFNDIQREFMEIVEEKRRQQLQQYNGSDVDSRESSAEKSDKADSDEVLVLDGDEVCAKKVPKHLKEFLRNTSVDDGIEDGDKDSGDGIWSPGQKSSFDREELRQLTIEDSIRSSDDGGVPVIWTPKSAGSSPIAERKEFQFRSVNFESPVLSRKTRKTTSNGSVNAEPVWNTGNNYTNQSELEESKKISTSQSAPGPGFCGDYTPRLPKAQNPTITLLQKAREGQIPPKSAAYIEQDRSRRKNDSPYSSQNDLIYNLRTESVSDSDTERPKRTVRQVKKQYEGIGPTTTHGMPVGLRSEIRDANMSQWYRKMYDTIHKHRPSKYDDEEYVTIRYKQRNRGKYPYVTGYLSEPEAGTYDSDTGHSDGNRYSTLDRRRAPFLGGSNSNVTNFSTDQAYIPHTSTTLPNTSRVVKPARIVSTSTNSPGVTSKKQEETTTITYKPEIQQSQSAISLSRPGKIENYTPGKSSISDIEAKKWWDEVMDIFDGWLDDHSALQFLPSASLQTSYNFDRAYQRRTMEKQQLQQRQKIPLVQPKGYLSQALKESGYESDSTLIFRRRDETAQQLNPVQQREVYKNIQRGGDVPLHGLRKSVPDRPKEEGLYARERQAGVSTMNRLRVHRSAPCTRSRSSSKEKPILCYPVLSTHESDTFAAYKRTAPSNPYKSGDAKIIAQKPPNPPKRKSSRNNSTLRMIHNAKSAGAKRHETCFSPVLKLPSTNVANVKQLREKISTKLSTNTAKTTAKKDGSLTKKCYCNKSKLPCSKCSKQTKKSPVEVKKAVVGQINSMNGNTSGAILAKLNGSKPSKSIERNKYSKTFAANSISSLKKSSKLSSPIPSVTSSRSTLKSTSMDSLKPFKSYKQKSTSKGAMSKGEEALKPLKKTKSKKELINTQVKSEEKSKPPMLTTKQPDGFFQQLFFGPDATAERPNRLKKYISNLDQMSEYSRSCDPTLGALKLYLGQTKPVTESRFKYLDMVRSRSTSPRSSPIILRYDERSISLPPKLIFTQTSRPATPNFERKKLFVCKDSSKNKDAKIDKIIFSQTSRPISPMVIRRSGTPVTPTSSSITSSRCPSPCSVETLYFSETSRPVSPIVTQQPPPRPKRPVSPIYQPPKLPNVIRSPSYRRIKQKRPRAHSADVESNRSLRFKELNKFYQDLERLGQLERTASSSDLRPRKKFEEAIIDYDRWQEVRQRERAERELTSLYRQLKRTQEEQDFLFRPKYVEGIKWRRDLDRGLRIKERSVDNLRNEFEKIRKEQIEKERRLKEDLNIKRGVYKSLWRGNSVVNVAQTLNEEQARSKSESRASVRQRIVDNEDLLTHGIGSRIWSSLSLEQVNILKNQLTAIYGNDKRFMKDDTNRTNNYIDVTKGGCKAPKELRVRRNSDTDNKSVVGTVGIIKSKSASAIKPTTILSEKEKKHLSHTISKEVLQLRNKRFNVLQAKETRGAIAAADANLSETPSPRTCYSLEVSEDDQKNQDFLLVLTKNDSKAYKDSLNETLEVWARPKADCDNLRQEKSETESASTDGSTKTVIFNDPNIIKPQTAAKKTKKDKILAKVEYFENKDKEIYTPIIYKPSDEPAEDIGDTITHKANSNLRRSQSNQDVRELFGESQLKRIATEPLSASRKVKYVRPSSPILRSAFPRCRSLSPENRHLPNVNLLKDRFEHYHYNNCLGMTPRRCASDPQLSKHFHDGEKVQELRAKFEYPKISGRGRSRVRKSGLISSSHLRAEDRYMPHINIINKIATLYPKTHRKETTRSSENLARILGIPVGEVHKLRERFDAADRRMSILGHMFTSSPNINELRDVAQYLSGDWYAHKHARAQRGDVVLRPRGQRPKSASPPRSKSKLASILKLPDRDFVPFRSWWSPGIQKHSVHFKEPEGPPPPPPCCEQEMNGELNFEQNADLISESPRKYVENEVTIHYRTPVRQEVKEIIDDQELAKKQAEAMRKIYEEERQRKHLQVSHSDNELQDRRSRRHTDNFIQSQKSPISLNRYDDFFEDIPPKLKTRPRSPEPRLVARALFNFVGQSARELTFKKGEVIFIRRQIDKNWYEGELNAMVGLFPSNYVEIVPYDGMKTTLRKPNEGQARAKYNFIAQSHLELSLAKGELVVVTRRVDDNWYEGRIGGRKGIFPVSYIEMLVDPQEGQIASTKPVASPAAHSLLANGTSGGKESMGTHSYVPTFPTQDLGMSYRAKPVQINSAGTYGSLKKNPIDQALHIDIQNDPVAYRALYKYRPQNEDELELFEGDVVQVLEKCDDGWFVGTSERTGAFGTFPGNYVEQIVN